MNNRYKLCIKGKNPDYFLRKVIAAKISIYDINKKYKELFITVDEDGYQKIIKFKTSYKVIIQDVSGVLKIKEVFNRYIFFILFFCLGIGINIFLSFIIFDVEVVHSNNYIKELVYDALREEGIKKFKFKISFSEKERIVNKILTENRDYLEWLEIEEVGTKYMVYAQQRKKNSEPEECGSRNIVAAKGATILEIKALKGEVLKKKYDYVAPGDVIISGTIYNKEDIMANRCADGQIFGEVWYKVYVELPVKYHEENVTGKSTYNIGYRFLNKKEVLLGKYETYKKEDVFVLESELLPISFGISKYLETEVIDKTYTLENSDTEALKIANDRISRQFKEGEEVLSKKVLKKELKDSKIIVEVFLRVKEDITSYKEITDEEIANQKKEEQDGG